MFFQKWTKRALVVMLLRLLLIAIMAFLWALALIAFGVALVEKIG